MSSPTQRSLKKLRDEGWACQVVEKFNSFTKRRIDVFGYGDILAIRPGEIALVQTTSGSNLRAREQKIKALPGFKAWHAAGGISVLHAWRKIQRNGRKIWDCRELSTRQVKYELWKPWAHSIMVEPGIKMLFLQGEWKKEEKDVEKNQAVH